MYQPGDYVVGYPNFFFDNGTKYTLMGGKILGAKNRNLLVNKCGLQEILKEPMLLRSLDLDKKNDDVILNRLSFCSQSLPGFISHSAA